MKETFLDKETREKERRSTTLITANREIVFPIIGQYLFAKNLISTSKYNALNFLPKNLVEQFLKLANVYFLIIAVLQSIPDITNSNGYPSILVPMSFVLTVSALKDLLEDYKRKKSDKEENNRKALHRKSNDWREVSWRNIKVGDICKVSKDERFPADLILLSSSDPKGICYIETKNLDGETNLKHKIASKHTQGYFKDDSLLDSFNGTVKCDDPNSFIYQFSGILLFGSVSVPLVSDQFLLRGSSLKNTDWIIGLVVYTGHETKIMLNSSRARAKMSTNERQMNNQIIYLFLLQLVICGICAIYNTVWIVEHKNTAVYLELNRANTNGFYLFVVNYFSWMLLFSNFVPISLLVTLEVVKFCQAIFISWDLDLYFEENDTPAGVQSSNLNDELGQVSYLFSDKTGTLTCNVMEFRKMTIKGVNFGSDARQDPLSKVPYVDFVDENFNKSDSNWKDFLLHLACCHTVLAEEKDGKIEYKASSPDELALVYAAKYFGYEFLARDADQNIELVIHNKKVVIEVLNIIEFNSDRKRMTVVIRTPDFRIFVLCKGADSVIIARLSEGNEHLSTTINNLESYGKIGLRTLLLATRELSAQEYSQWNEKFAEAMSDIRNREEKVQQCAEIIECELQLVGATAIEDRLQEGVPETIQFLREAGIKVWVLTGDKIETAINIGFSCKLITPSMTQLHVTSTKTREIESELKRALEVLSNDQVKSAALILSGESLLKIRDDLQNLLLKICEQCNVVLACRVSPQQKADIVKLIRDSKPDVRTLSIGDGANDVNMITAAHIGVGIAGLEGKQAVRASDYSVGQFRYLKKLLFVHGRECYRKNSTLICYNFYKNVLLVLPILYYGIFSAFSGQIFYNIWIYQFFNMFYAAFPIMIYAIIDKELTDEELLSNPHHYELGMKKLLFSTKKFWQWIAEAFIQGFVILVISTFTVCYTAGRKHYGQISPMPVAANLTFGVVVIYVNIKVFMCSYAHTWFSILVMVLSVLMYFFTSAIVNEWLPISDAFDNFDSHGATSMMFGNPNSYVACLLLVYLGFFIQPLVEFFFKALQKIRKPKGVKVLDIAMKKSTASDGQPDRASKYTGFAFSGDAGHTPQITEPIIQNIKRRTGKFN